MQGISVCRLTHAYPRALDLGLPDHALTCRIGPRILGTNAHGVEFGIGGIGGTGRWQGSDPFPGQNSDRGQSRSAVRPEPLRRVNAT